MKYGMLFGALFMVMNVSTVLADDSLIGQEVSTSVQNEAFYSADNVFVVGELVVVSLEPKVVYGKVIEVRTIVSSPPVRMDMYPTQSSPRQFKLVSVKISSVGQQHAFGVSQVGKIIPRMMVPAVLKEGV